MRDAHQEAGPISHDEAAEIALAYIDKAFGNKEKPGRRVLHCIPANPKTDTDLRLMAYIAQQRAKDKPKCACCGCTERNETNTWFTCDCKWENYTDSECLKHPGKLARVQRDVEAYQAGWGAMIERLASALGHEQRLLFDTATRAIPFLREAWRANDGAEGESVRLICKAFEHALAHIHAIEQGAVASIPTTEEEVAAAECPCGAVAVCGQARGVPRCESCFLTGCLREK